MNLTTRHIVITLLLFVFLTATVQCTSTRWTVNELNAVDQSEEPTRIDSAPAVLKSSEVTPEHPFLTLEVYTIEELEYTERVQVQRTVQKYRPKWKFTFLGSMGAALAFYAANTSGFIENPTSTQSFALNSTGVILTALAFTNMRPVEEPIYTGETKYLRRSGSVTRPDTVRSDLDSIFETAVIIEHRSDVIYSETYETLNDNGLQINLAGLANDLDITGNDPGNFDVRVHYNDQENTFSIPVDSFMKPLVVVTSPVAELRNAPEYDQRPPLTEVGNGSELLLTDDSYDRWFQIQFGGSNLYLARESGEIHWQSESITADPTIVTVDEVPFGEISVEYAVPVIKTENETDFGLIVSNHRNNQIGVRRYLERDYRLMELYYRNSFGISTDNLILENIEADESIDAILETIEADTSAGIHLYIGGFATIVNEVEETDIKMIHIDAEGREQTVSLTDFLVSLAEKPSKKMIVFIDLEFDHERGGLQLLSGNNGTDLYSNIAEEVTSRNENSALIFSSRPEQKSNLFESIQFEQKYHHIFPYYIAQALQQRRIQLPELVRHIENQVEYTSRRLHDRSQTIQAFGNMNLNFVD